MKPIFADTSYWAALVNPRDRVHDKAMRVTQQLAAVTLLTTEMVLVELLNGFADSAYREAVGEMVARLRQDANLMIVAQNSVQLENALQRYRQAADKSWSLTDCASFEVMESEDIASALTSDRHFVQAGFEALLR